MTAAARSLLFVPGDRPERFDKAASSGADAVVLDLEDAVAPPAKAAALAHVLAWLRGGRTAVVRVNAPGTPTHEAEVEALAGTSAAVMLPKTESPEQVLDVRLRLGPEQGVLPLLETPRGIREADEVAAAPGVVRLALGTVDLAAVLGVDHSSHAAFAYSRGRLVMASAAAGLPGPVDGVTTALDDAELLAADLSLASGLGFTGKLCIHPRQVAAVNAAMTPSEAELVWARQVVAAASGSGVVVVAGAMVDAPVLTRAERVLERAAALRG